jgi:hypothetical protein
MPIGFGRWGVRVENTPTRLFNLGGDILACSIHIQYMSVKSLLNYLNSDLECVSMTIRH